MKPDVGKGNPRRKAENKKNGNNNNNCYGLSSFRVSYLLFKIDPKESEMLGLANIVVFFSTKRIHLSNTVKNNVCWKADSSRKSEKLNVDTQRHFHMEFKTGLFYSSSHFILSFTICVRRNSNNVKTADTQLLKKIQKSSVFSSTVIFFSYSIVYPTKAQGETIF